MNKKAIILLNILEDNKGGLTNSAIKKANILAESNIDTVIITHRNQKKLPIDIYNLYKNKKLNSSVKVRNLYWSCTNLDNQKTIWKLFSSYFSKFSFLLSYKLKQSLKLDKSQKYKSQKEFLETIINKDDIIFFEDNIQKWTEILNDYSNKKIVTIHNHPNLDTTSKFIVEHQDKYNIVNYLTKKQMQEFQERNAYYFPHGTVYYNKKNPNRIKRIVTLTRFDFKQKNVLDAIQAFYNIKDQFPEFIYEIYGDGPNKKEILDFISYLKLNNRVFLKPYTINTDFVFRNSYASINLSYYEGFGLSILESINNNCPCIASNVDYGPNEIIINQFTGFIVDNNIEQITNVMYEIIKNNEYYYQNTFKFNNGVFNIENYRKNLLNQFYL